MELKELLKKRDYLDKNSIILGYRGSIAHGMYLPNSDPNSIDDKDLMAVIVPPLEYYYGLQQFGSRGTKETMDEEWDVVAYELQKYVSLLKKGNPNVISMLYLEPEHYIKVEKEGWELIQNRDIFISKAVYRSFVGYAYAQLSKMEKGAHRGYMGEKRKAMVAKYGYDTKNAAHLIRLLRMAIEFLNEGKFIVKRPDASELLEIKTGQWSLEMVKDEAQHLFIEAHKANRKCDLPDEVDDTKVDELLVKILKQRFEK